MAPLTGSVGFRGTNHLNDIRIVQGTLNRFTAARGGANPRLATNGVCGPETIEAIRVFQRIAVGSPDPDGRIDVGRRTHAQLAAAFGGTLSLPPASAHRDVRDNRDTWGTLTPMSINGHSLEVWGADSAHQAIIQETLSKIPLTHLQLIPRVVVGDVVGMGTIRESGNSVNRSPHSRLELTINALNNPRKLVAARNGGHIHMTILHETGHHVDWFGGGVTRGLTTSQLRQLDSWFASIGYEGVTQGPGEAHAELYWRLYAARSNLPETLRTAVCALHGIP